MKRCQNCGVRLPYVQEEVDERSEHNEQIEQAVQVDDSPDRCLSCHRAAQGKDKLFTKVAVNHALKINIRNEYVRM